MIVRILGEGQLEVEDSARGELNALDEALEKAMNEGDELAFRPALTALLDRVRALGTPLAAEVLEPSDLILPPADADIAEVRTMLTEDGRAPY
jgi:hypothetical protein